MGEVFWKRGYCWGVLEKGWCCENFFRKRVGGRGFGENGVVGVFFFLEKGDGRRVILKKEVGGTGEWEVFRGREQREVKNQN